MRKPQPPPPLMPLLQEKVQEPEFFPRALAVARATEPLRYLPWDHLRSLRPPDGLSTQEWWLVNKVMREGIKRRVPLAAVDGRPFSYALPDASRS